MSRLHVNREACTLCGNCVQACPFDALEISEDRLKVSEQCVLCGACLEHCPEDALSIPSERRTAPERLERYRGVWVFAERSRGEAAGGSLQPVALELLGKGRELADARGSSLSAVVLGTDTAPALDTLRRYPVDRIYAAEHPALERFCSETYAEALAQLIRRERPEILLCGATSAGRSFMPRLAALVKTGLTADCTGLQIDPEEGLLRQTRPAFGGNIMATILCPAHRPQMATVRPNVLSRPEPGAQREVEVLRFNPEGARLAGAPTVLEACVEEAGRANLGEADVIVSGGRGVGSPEGFEPLRDLAEALGGRIGASRAAVDAGWIPYPHQVGQTGRTVQPRLYVACGISGAVQHLVGMRSAETIVAINRDPGAPIFGVADFGLVGDLHTIVPRLARAVRSRREGSGL